MNQNTLFAVTFLLLISTACQNISNEAVADKPQTETIDDKVIIQRLIVGVFDEVWSNLDTNKVKDFHTDDFLLLENGVVWNNDSIINYQKAELGRMQEYGYQRQNKFEFIKIEKSPNTIWAAYDNFATWITNDEITARAHWLESAVAVKTEDGWKLQMLHSTRVRN